MVARSISDAAGVTVVVRSGASPIASRAYRRRTTSALETAGGVAPVARGTAWVGIAGDTQQDRGSKACGVADEVSRQQS